MHIYYILGFQHSTAQQIQTDRQTDRKANRQKGQKWQISKGQKRQKAQMQAAEIREKDKWTASYSTSTRNSKALAKLFAYAHII